MQIHMMRAYPEWAYLPTHLSKQRQSLHTIMDTSTEMLRKSQGLVYADQRNAEV